MASTLREYCEMVAARPPDIALIDLNLPDGNAQEALCLLSESNPFPVVVMTSMGNEEVAVAAIKLGAVDYFVKSPETFANMPRFMRRALLPCECERGKKLTLCHLLIAGAVGLLLAVLVRGLVSRRWR